MQTLDTLRDEIARITRRGIGMPAAGMAFWLAAAQFGQMYTPRGAALATFFATGAVFPLGWWFTRLAGGDLFAKGHPLNGLGGTLNAVQFCYWPVLVAVYFTRPELVPFTMATLFGSHFLPYGWFYRSRGYLGLGMGVPLVATALQLAAPAHAFVAIPLAVAAVYALAVARVAHENHVQQRFESTQVQA
jgi:hypothetical protein